MGRYVLTVLTVSCVAVAACAFASLSFAEGSLGPMVAAPNAPLRVPANAAPAAGGAIPGNAPSNKPSTTVADNYTIAEEDVLRMDVWGEPQLSNTQMQVTPDGNVNVPFLGMMKAAGLTQGELTKEIAKALADQGILYDARIQITLVTMHQPTARVLGEVNRPGAITFKDGDSILDAVAQAGSYTQNAWLEKATITHKDSAKPIPLDLRQMLDKGDLTENKPLQKGDTIYIPPEDNNNKFYVLGQVYKPGIYQLKENTTVLTAISMAGGATDRGKLKNTAVLRSGPSRYEKVRLNLNNLFDKGDLTQDVALKAGDTVIVPERNGLTLEKISTFLNTVVNFGYVRRLGLF